MQHVSVATVSSPTLSGHLLYLNLGRSFFSLILFICFLLSFLSRILSHYYEDSTGFSSYKYKQGRLAINFTFGYQVLHDQSSSALFNSFAKRGISSGHASTGQYNQTVPRTVLGTYHTLRHNYHPYFQVEETEAQVRTSDPR